MVDNTNNRVVYVNSLSPGILLALQILFIVLKATDTVTWPWIWVLAPIWMPLGVAILLTTLMFITLAVFSKHK